jgi:Flp pilus assembly pilin Flp
METEMRSMTEVFATRRVGADDGQDLIEYALITGLIAMVAVGAITSVGVTVKNAFWTVIAAAIP